MLFVMLFFVELLLLFFLSRVLTRSLSYLFYRLSGNEKIMIYLMAIFFFPGTVIHELAHAVTAMLVFVHVGRMEFVPKMIGSGVKMGSVEIGNADPIRRALIGMAPFFWGTAIIIGILYTFQNLGGIENIGITLLTGYVVFEISNTMFSSRKDMEGTLGMALIILALGASSYYLGFRIPEINPDALLTKEIQQLFLTGSIFLLIPLVIDITLIAVLKLLRRIHH